MFRLWVDDVRPAPSEDWIWAKTVREARAAIHMYERQMSVDTILISLDHDAGDYAEDGKDYIDLLNWLEYWKIPDTGYFFHLHSQNPVGVENMRRIISHNGWREVYKI